MRHLHKILCGFGWLALFATFSGCANIGTMSKAPVTEIPTGGSVSDRQQQYLLNQVKWQHEGSGGAILGRHFFTDSKYPIAGARTNDTLDLLQGPFVGKYNIKKVWRQVDSDTQGRRRRQVIIEVDRPIVARHHAQHWKVSHKGSGGITLPKNTFTDATSFLPDVPLGTQLLIRTGGEMKEFTVIQTLADRFGLKELQRVGYIVREPLPTNLQNLSYEVRIPDPSIASKLNYRIHWRGSSITGHNFTIGINRRRYRQQEIEDLFQSNGPSKKELRRLGAKRGTAIVFQVVGGVAIVVGGFLALVRRDDFPGTQQAIPWSIVGGGLVFVLSSIPLSVSANNDYLRAAQTYNSELVRRLDIPKPKEFAQKPQVQPDLSAPSTDNSARRTQTE